MRGKFITIEGCEGVGKSTQLRFLREYCEQNGIDAVFTREPGGTAIAEKIRAIILDAENMGMDYLTELLLYTAARRQHTAERIEKALQNGQTVFCDRYCDSTAAYQGYARGLDLKLIEKLNKIAMGDTKIDLTIFIDVNPTEGFRRKGGASRSDRLELEEADFHQRVYKGFQQIAQKESERVVCIQANGTKFETHEKIVVLLKARGVL